MQQAGTRRGAAAAKLPPFFLPKCDGQNSHCALPRRFVPPFQCSLQIPLRPISCSIRTDCYRGAAQELFRPRHASYQNHSSRFLTGGAGMGREFLEHIERFFRARFPNYYIYHIITVHTEHRLLPLSFARPCFPRDRRPSLTSAKSLIPFQHSGYDSVTITCKNTNRPR